MSKRYSRRDFLKGAGVLGASSAAVTLVGCGGTEEAQAKIEWDRTVDVVVVGYGLAGAATALAVKKAGADVLVLEKMPEEMRGGNSKVSANLVFIPGNETDGKAYFKAMLRPEDLAGNFTEEFIDVWVKEMIANRTFLEDEIGLTMVALPAITGMSPELPHLPGAENCLIYGVDGKMAGARLWIPVDEEVQAQKIAIEYESPVKNLVASTDKSEVLGVTVQQNGSDVNIKAKKGVVLCCGSFEFDETMKANYLAAPILAAGTPGNTGDGVKMAMGLGAEMWHMNNAMGPITLAWRPPADEFGEDLHAGAPLTSAPGVNYFTVDKYGKRFMNERRAHDHGHGWDEINYYDGNKGEYPRIPYWVVFDEAGRSNGPLVHPGISWFGYHSGYQWSADNSVEIEKGWILKGDTIEELAGKMGVDPAALAETLETYNGYAAAGEDKDFGRMAKQLVALEGPFYAMESWPVMVNVQGGPKRNEKAQVLKVGGEPIKRLYSAGECGSCYGWQYQGGGNLGECMAFGRIAGTNASAEEDWS